MTTLVIDVCIVQSQELASGDHVAPADRRTSNENGLIRHVTWMDLDAKDHGERERTYVRYAMQIKDGGLSGGLVL